MPTYEYACRSCGQHLEVVQSFTDDPLRECPGCKGELRKVFSPIGITFKGSGFYKTDSRGSSKSSSNGGAANGSRDTGSGSAGSGSSDSSSSSSGSSGGAPSGGSSAGGSSGDKAAAAS